MGYRINLDTLRQVLGDPERKSIPKMAWEITSCWRRQGRRPTDYIRGFAYRRHMVNPLSFLTTRDCKVLWDHFSFGWAAVEPLLKDKLKFQRHFDGVAGVRLPRFLGYNVGDTFYFGSGEVVPLTTEENLRQVLARLLDDARANGNDSLFVKEQRGMHGSGIFKLSEHTPTDKLWKAVQRADFLFEQTVEQHPALAAVAPDTLNTLRVTTVRRGRAEPEVASAWIRFGRLGSVVDNASAGGVFNGVDLSTGRARGRFMTKFERGVGLHATHPDTGAALTDFTVPLFEEVKEMALAAARHIEYPVVGWDIGVSVDGPVVVEGNGRSNYKSDQTANGIGYLEHPVLGTFIREQLKIAEREEPETAIRLRALREAQAAS